MMQEQPMRKREVSYDGSTYKVRSNKIIIPDFSQMERTAILLWMMRHTYARGYSKPNPLNGLGGAIQIISEN
jgi:hypothetical protein